MIPNEIIFKKLNYRRCNQKEMYKLFSSINSFFCIKNKKIDFYNPNLNFFTNFVEDSYTFNFHEKIERKKMKAGFSLLVLNIYFGIGKFMPFNNSIVF